MLSKPSLLLIFIRKVYLHFHQLQRWQKKQSEFFNTQALSVQHLPNRSAYRSEEENQIQFTCVGARFHFPAWSELFQALSFYSSQLLRAWEVHFPLFFTFNIRVPHKLPSFLRSRVPLCSNGPSSVRLHI